MLSATLRESGPCPGLAVTSLPSSRLCARWVSGAEEDELEATEGCSVKRVQSGEVETVEDTLVVESHVAIEIDGEGLIRTTCSPAQLREWAIGHLFSEGRIACPEDVAEIRETDGVFSVELSVSAPTEPGPLTPIESGWRVTPDRILAVARETAEKAGLFHRTGGTHAMAIANRSGIVSLAEDISRTCALEKALGIALERRADFARSIAFLSSRAPSRMIEKLARCGTPIVAAVSAPTIDAVRLAEELNVCLCGFVRDNRLNVYAGGWRLGL
jgi:FdhD protein